jgi:hypothetical protein
MPRYAAGWDEIKSRFKGLKAGGGGGGKIVLDSQAVLVKSEVAKAQIESGKTPTGEVPRVPRCDTLEGMPAQPGARR